MVSAVEAIRRLDQERNLWLATVRPDGRPHLAPVWFTYVRTRFWIATGRTSIRAENLRRNQTASVSLEGADHPVAAEGTVITHLADRPDLVIHAFEAKYGWDITVDVDPDLGPLLLLELLPQKWLFDLVLPTPGA